MAQACPENPKTSFLETMDCYYSKNTILQAKLSDLLFLSSGSAIFEDGENNERK
jgi:hypothetical protein